MTQQFSLHKNRTVDLGLEEPTELTHHFTPHNISIPHCKQIFAGIPESLRKIARDMAHAQWKFYAVSQSRGRCYYHAKTITIPVWAIHDPKPGYKVWYVAHELAHAFTASDSHGLRFMARLIETCPEEYVHYELGYKPRNATAAGIVDPSLRILRVPVVSKIIDSDDLGLD